MDVRRHSLTDRRFLNEGCSRVDLACVAEFFSTNGLAMGIWCGASYFLKMMLLF